MKTNLNTLFIAFICCLSYSLDAQLTEQWESNYTSPSPFVGGKAKVCGTSLIYHTSTSEIQTARSVSLDGLLNWSFSHSQFDSCVNCLFAEVKDVEILTDGSAIAAGVQSRWNFSAQYLHKLNADGTLEYVRVFDTPAFSAEFHSIRRGKQDTSVYFVSGEQFENSINTIGPFFYKVDATTGDVLDQVYLGEIGFAESGSFENSGNLIEVDNTDRIYANVSSNGPTIIEHVAYNSDLQPAWEYSDTLSEDIFIINNIRPLILSNGDILFATVYADYMNDEFTLQLNRFNNLGELIASATHGIPSGISQDVSIADVSKNEADELVFFFNLIINGGKAGPGDNDPLIMRVNSDLQVEWTFLYQDNPNFPAFYDNAQKIYIDNVGNVLASYDLNSNNSNLDAPKRNSILLLNPSGALADAIDLPFPLHTYNYALAPVNENSFIAVFSGDSAEQTGNLTNSFIRFTYDASVGIQQQFSGNKSIGVYPNPANSYVTFVNPLSNDEMLRVYTLQGKLLFIDQVSGNSNYMLNLSDLPEGMYVVEMGTLRSKFIVSKS